MTGIRVLILFPHITMPGGALKYARKLAEELRASGATVSILSAGTCTITADQTADIAIAGVQMCRLGAGKQDFTAICAFHAGNNAQ